MSDARTRAVTAAERARIAELHGGGLMLSAVARELGWSRSTIHRVAADLGLSWDRAQTRAATEARQADNAARRAANIGRLYGRADDFLDQLEQDEHALVEVSMGTVVRYTTARLPAKDQKALIQAIATATGKAVKLEEVDAGDAADPVLSLLDGIAAGFGLHTRDDA